MCARDMVDYGGNSRGSDKLAVWTSERLRMGKSKSMDELLEGRPFDRVVIVLCVRRYLRLNVNVRPNI
jgi:hypothetical protein